MEAILNLEPKRVFYYFSEISKIPHGSGNTKKISDFCVEFARKEGLRYIQDEFNNVIIFKSAQNTVSDKTVMLQGHLDMVCEKEPGYDIDFSNDPIALKVDGDWIRAEGTTLGGDDGIAIAYALAVLEDKSIVHPDIEAIFTVDEEIGLIGANSIDLTETKGNILLNIDSEQEGIFTVSCAGGATVSCVLPLNYSMSKGIGYKVCIDGLLGGHSGVEIDKYRANSNILAARLLNILCDKYSIKLISLNGGLKDNAIPNLTVLEILSDSDIEDTVKEFEREVRNEFRVSDPDLKITVEKKRFEGMATDEELTLKASRLLLAQPNGIINMDLEIPGLVKTSLNMGILKTDPEKMEFSYSVRSSLKSEKSALIEKIKAVSELAGAKTNVSGEYSPWEYRADSDLRGKVTAVYERLFGKAPKYEAIHAGLECGVLAEKIDNLDAVSFGPDMPDIHTPKERASIASVKRVWDFLIELLADLCN
ncbi:MAG: aminoacyl-histidine dipeptidase [Ruminococcaceae bacterium]|nr:aminoacyl-histidine dipeptidase [Oscillospiraceae bacterium]